MIIRQFVSSYPLFINTTTATLLGENILNLPKVAISVSVKRSVGREKGMKKRDSNFTAFLCSRNVMIRWELGQGHSGSLTVSVIKLIEITSHLEYGSKHQYSGKTYFWLFGNFRLTMYRQVLFLKSSESSPPAVNSYGLSYWADSSRQYLTAGVEDSLISLRD